MSEDSLPLFADVAQLNADRVLDTKLVSVLIVDAFYPTIVATPLRIATDFECDPLVVLEVVPVFEYITDAEFERTSVFVPVERVEIVADEAA